MGALFKTPKIPKPQPTVTPQDASLAAMDEAARLRKRVGRDGNRYFFGKRRNGNSVLGSAAGLTGSSGGSGGGSGGNGSPGGSGGGSGGGSRPSLPSI